MTDVAPILIVEDNAILAMDLQDELRDHGHGALCAGSVVEAMELNDETPARLAILDMHLGSETTFDLARQLGGQGVPFIFLSGNDTSSLPEDLRSCKVLTKPVRIDDVLEAIRGAGQS